MELHFGPRRDEFLDLLAKFMIMLGDGLLHNEYGWLTRARLWRVIFMLHEDGSFDPSESLTFALQASSDSALHPSTLFVTIYYWRSAGSQCRLTLFVGISRIRSGSGSSSLSETKSSSLGTAENTN